MKKVLSKISSLLNRKKVMPKKNAFVLAESSFLRYFTFSSLYGAQGIPEGLTFFAIPAWLAMQGKSAIEIGSFVGIIGIPWSFKILIAPMMDRFTYLPMGRKRPWVLAGQFGLIISLLGAAMINDPLNNLSLLMVAGFFISFFGAMQDIAVDGMAIDNIPIHEQARANGLMWGSKTIGVSLSLLASTTIINSYGFHYATIFLAFIISCIILIPLFMRENPGEKITPWSIGEPSEKSKEVQVQHLKIIFKHLKKVFFLPSSLVLGTAVFIIAIGNGLMETLLPVFTIQEIGWTDAHFSKIMATSNIVAGLSGMFVGGALIDFFGKIRMMSIFLILLISVMVIMGFGKTFWNHAYFVAAFVFAYNILVTFLTIAFLSTAMELCWIRISATQFTLYMAINNLGRAAGAGYLGEIKNLLVSWEYVILVYAVAAVIMLMLLAAMNTKKHVLSVHLLENNHLFTEKE